MADKASDTPKDSGKSPFDLNSLSGLDFGPSWADEKQRKQRPKPERSYSDGPRKDRRPAGGGRDRRPKGGTGGGSGGGGGRPQGDRRSGGGDRRRGERPQRREVFEPTVSVDIYPQDEAFDALVNRLRSSARTYQLFEIAHLILEKPERFVVVVANKKGEGAARPLFYSVPGHLPFETEDEALSHVVTEHIDRFFEVEEIDIDPPSGNFQMVNRCGMTGELLGPPNFHRYQDFLKSHYASRINGTSFERFVAKIETVKEQEVIDAWTESMKKGHRYKVKDRKEGEPESFETLEAARSFLLQHRKEQVVHSADNVRFAGRDIGNLSRGNIRRSVEAYVEQQRHFPLDSANNIRGRLRRHKFTVYKKGSKGVSFVCAVKRKFRDANTVFTESIQELIEFIEKNPNIFASKLSKVYLGIDSEKQKTEVLKVTDEEVAKAAEAKTAAAKEETSSEAAKPEEVEVPKVEATTEITPKAELSEEEQEKLKQLMIDLRWLITEGYVTEYGDGRLFAAEPLPAPKKKPDAEPAKAKEEKTEAVADVPATSEAEPAVAAVAEAPAADTVDVAEPASKTEDDSASAEPESTEPDSEEKKA